LHELDAEHLLYESAKSGPGGTDPLRLTPLQLLDRLAALVPPPRVHRHRYFGVLWRRHAHRRLHHRPGHDPRHPRPLGRAHRAAAHRAGPRSAPGGSARCRTGDFDPHATPAPEYEFDQRVTW